MKAHLAIENYMSRTLHTIGSDQNLKKAHELMREYKVRHLPVLNGGQLVGILSDRDLALVESLKDVQLEKVRVDEACTPEPYFTEPKANLKTVCREMAKHKYGATLVLDHQKLVGIFTWIDALRVLEQTLVD